MKVRNIAATATILSVLFSFSPQAHAEGSFDTYAEGVRDGAQTRGWTDKGVDAAPTTILAETCLNNPHGSPGKVEFTLRRTLTLRPDPDLGSRALNGCYGGSAQGDWGTQAPGDYHADIHTFDWNLLTIKRITVSY